MKLTVEYRSLSAWFASTEQLIKWCFNQTEKAIDFVNKDGILCIQNFGDEIQRIINTNDKEGAEKWINEYNLELV